MRVTLCVTYFQRYEEEEKSGLPTRIMEWIQRVIGEAPVSPLFIGRLILRSRVVFQRYDDEEKNGLPRRVMEWITRVMGGQVQAPVSREF